MNPRHHAIIRKDHDKLALWLEAAPDLPAAEAWVAELTSFWPGEFQIMDQQSHQIVEKVIGPSDRKWAIAVDSSVSPNCAHKKSGWISDPGRSSISCWLCVCFRS
jgi:hypothetical protein